ncbi:DUF952 domain-containing protein [Nocardioides sp. CFH 31398]|uniref:DUF952 domain-containing protein n=1 Tax=Nocardioides sp. CFH 31398 TaxID=2919579 RepID=UPI001F066F09|nr:DUF952 domain-containing protein [Nocardioides sp. CFH 31398]MCH1868849.1 DUF952 domain-containing protein [Nocardioides sp. CFH 31398]
MRIFHLAERADWEAARGGRYYDRSTRGASLAEVGFVHCAHAHQWQVVRDRFYSDVTEPLLLLTIDTDLLDAPVVEEPGEPGSSERFPHVYGAIPVAAVVAVTELAPPSAAPAAQDPAGGRSFSSLLMAEIGVRVVLAVGVMVVAALVGTLVQESAGPPYGLLATMAAFAAATVAAVVLYRRRERRAG